MKRLLCLVVTGLSLFMAVQDAQSQQAHTPQRGSQERAAILAAIRPAIEETLQTPVVFVVRQMSVAQGWVFVALEPQRPGGRLIDPRTTPLANEMDMRDGLTTYALLRLQQGVWHIVEIVIGPTDVAWDMWPEQYGAPHAVFP